MKTLSNFFLILLMVYVSTNLFSASGVFEYYLDTQNDSGTKFHGNYLNGTSFNGSNLGTLLNLGESQIISVTGIKTFQNSGDDIISARINYRVWKSGDSPGSFNTVNLPFFADLGGGDKEWQRTNINLSSNVSESGTYFVEVYFDATGVNNGFQFTISEDNGDNNFTASFTVEESVLPVRLGSFKTKVNQNAITVSWTTLSELNNEKFDLYRSSDGRIWNHLKTVFAKYGRTESDLATYNFNDVNPNSGINHYKLTQTDYDGTTTELGIESVYFQQMDVSIYPNPFVDMVHIKLPEAQAYQVKIIDMSGRVINNHSFRGDFYQLQLQDTAPGQYHLNLLNQNGKPIHSSKITKLR